MKGNGQNRLYSLLLKGPLYFILFWVLLGFILVPMVQTVARSLDTGAGVGIQNYVDYFHLINNRQVVWNTLHLGILSVLACGAVGTTLAVYMNFVEVKYRKIIHSILLSPMMVPGVIIVIAFIQLYGESGLVTKLIQWIMGFEKPPFVLTGLGGILFVHAYTQYVYFYLNVSVALHYLDYSTIEAARGLGASKIKIFTSILVPAVLPALYSSAIIAFIAGIGSFSAPVLLGGRYRVLSTQIMLSKANNYLNLASMQVVILMLMGLSVMALARYFESKHAQESPVRGVSVSPGAIRNPVLRWVLKGFMGAMVIMIAAPVIAIFFLSFVKSGSLMVDIFPKEFVLDNYRNLFTKPRVLRPFLNSISMSTATVIVGLAISLPLSYLTAKRKSSLNALAELIVMLPWAMPVSTIAVNLINAFNVQNMFVFNHVLIGTFWMLPIAYIITALPLLMRTNILAFESFNSTLEDASRSLGAGVVHTFTQITLPIVFPAIIAGGALIFIRTVGEYTVSTLLYGVHNRPISIAMVNAMQEYDIGLSMTYGVATIALCMLAMGLILNFNRGVSLKDNQ